jgi:4-hydroxy-tetrahydrodipicolinate reductase
VPARVIQWGIGNTGAFALRYLVSNPAYELVGVLCHSPNKAGRDAGELVGRPSIGVPVTRDKREVAALSADIVVYMPRTMHQDPSVPDSPDHTWYLQLCELLRTGKNVVTPITAGSHHRHLARGEEFRAGLDAAGQAGNSTVAFLGLDPGFFTDALPLSVAAAVGEVRQIRTYEVLSYAHYPNAGTLGRLGIGGDPNQISANVEAMIKPTWGGVPYVLADAVGVELDGIEIDIEIEVAPETFTSPGGMTVERGSVGGLNFQVSGLLDGVARFVVNHVTRMRDDIGTQWPVVGERGGYRIEIDAFPPVTLDFPLGLPGGTGNAFDDALAMTAARSVNAIDAVIAAAPGYRSFRELAPLVAAHTVH